MVAVRNGQAIFRTTCSNCGAEFRNPTRALSHHLKYHSPKKAGPPIKDTSFFYVKWGRGMIGGEIPLGPEMNRPLTREWSEYASNHIGMSWKATYCLCNCHYENGACSLAACVDAESIQVRPKATYDSPDIGDNPAFDGPEIDSKPLTNDLDTPPRVSYKLLLAAVWRTHKHTCEWCGMRVTHEFASVHHRTPREWGGSDNDRNLMLVHKGACHDDIEQWTMDHRRPPSEDELKESRQRSGGIVEPKPRRESPLHGANILADLWADLDSR